MYPGAGAADWLGHQSPGCWRVTGNTAFSSPVLKIVYSVPRFRPHPSRGHRNVLAAVFSSRMCPTCRGRSQRRSPSAGRWALSRALGPVRRPPARSAVASSSRSRHGSVAGSVSTRVLHGSCASAVTSQQLLAQPQKSLLASALRRYAQSELKMRLLRSAWH